MEKHSNTTSTDTVLYLFEEASRNFVEQYALVSQNECLTYGELERRSRCLAAYLVAKKQTSGKVIAIEGVSSCDMIIALLGVMRSGAVALLVDMYLPQSFRRQIIHEAKASLILLVGEQAPASGDVEVATIKLNQVELTPTLDEAIPELPNIHGSSPAYIFFTSGTTARPKGILGVHRSLQHFIKWQISQFDIYANDRIAQLTSPSFDVFLRDIFLPLCSGACLVLPDKRHVQTAEILLPWLDDMGITVLHIVPSLLQSWLRTAPEYCHLSSIRYYFSAGEPLTGKLVNDWRTHFSKTGRFINLYGPTETTLAKFWYEVPDSPESGILPVGHPIPDTYALILSSEQKILPIGEEGEVAISTHYGTMGYINAPEKNTAQFIPNPNVLGEIVYRTGDIGFFNQNGDLCIKGRCDHQVKVNGTRVEPEGLTAILQEHYGLSAGVVVAQKRISGSYYLIAYWVPKDASINLSTTDIRQYMQKRLPPPLVPTVYIELNRLPLTVRGKLDYRSLPISTKSQRIVLDDPSS